MNYLIAFCTLLALLLWLSLPPRARRIRVRIYSMSKIVGQNITVTAAGVPAGSTLSNVAFQADPATFQPVSQSGNVAVFLCLQAATGVTIAATGTAADGSSVSGVSDPFDVGAPVATSIAVTVE